MHAILACIGGRIHASSGLSTPFAGPNSCVHDSSSLLQLIGRCAAVWSIATRLSTSGFRRYSRGDTERAPGYPPHEGRGPTQGTPYGNGPSGPPQHGPPGAAAVPPSAAEYANANGRAAAGPPPPPPPRDANDFSRGPPPADRHLFNAHANEHAHTNGG